MCISNCHCTIYFRDCLFSSKYSWNPDPISWTYFLGLLLGSQLYSIDIYIFFLSLFILRDKESKQGVGQRENRRIPSSICQSRVQCRTQMHKTVRSRPEPTSRVGCLTNWATQALHLYVFFNASTMFLLLLLYLFFYSKYGWQTMLH